MNTRWRLYHHRSSHWVPAVSTRYKTFSLLCFLLAFPSVSFPLTPLYTLFGFCSDFSDFLSVMKRNILSIYRSQKIDGFSSFMLRNPGFGKKRIIASLRVPYSFRVKNKNIHRETVNYVRLEDFTAVTMMNGVFWDVTLCGSCKNRRFGGT
jgi:hypothetical protein